MKTIIISTIFLTSFIFSSCSNSEETGTFKCPMECEGEKTYDKTGSCPVCKMDLEKVEDTE